MKIKHYFYNTLILAVLFSSCEKYIKFSGDETGTKLVLNGLLSSDSIIKIKLTESKFFLKEGHFNTINNATVELWKDGNKIENLLNKGKGYYTGNYIPKTGDNIRVTAFCEGFDRVDCSTEIISPTPVNSADSMNYNEEKIYSRYIYSEKDGTSHIDSSAYNLSINFDLNITFKDPKDIPNYYTIKVFIKYYFPKGNSAFVPLFYTSDDIVFKTGKEMGFLDDKNKMKTIVFNDDLFDGKQYNIKIKAYNYDDNYFSNYTFDTPFKIYPEPVDRDIYVELQSLSYDYYMYLKTIEANSNLSKLLESLSEPIQIYTNVKGGIGILGSFASSIFIISLK